MNTKTNTLLQTVLKNLARLKNANYSTSAPKPKKLDDHCLLSCKNSRLNHFVSSQYGKLDEVTLASKGWNHSKAKNDHFQINPLPTEEETWHSFQDMALRPELIDSLKTFNVLNSTEFQRDAIDGINTGDHILLAAETGCGKTLAYLLPAINKLVKSEEFNSPQILVLVPNRELAFQVGEIANHLCASIGMKAKVVTGGRTKMLMMNPEFEEIEVLVGTPGAIGKLATVGVYKMDQVKVTVLDESDTLLDDSFNDRISGLLRKVFHSQLILVSATIPRHFPDILNPIEPSVRRIVSQKVHRPILHVKQQFLRLLKSAKPSHLLQLANQNRAPMLVFSNRNETCNWLALFLRENGIECANINGDMNHAIRIDQWNQFVSGKALILSATDVASRGLNTIQVQHVLNYDFPFYAADYLHRVGRVGRLGSSNNCKITNFVSGPKEITLAQQIEFAIRTNQPLPDVDGNITNIVQKKIMREMRHPL